MDYCKEELWRPIVILKRGEWFDFTGRYSISNYGRVLNIQKGTYLKPKINRGGYCFIQLYEKGKRKPHSFKIHRLVATAFISNPCYLPEVNHIDGDKTNNKVSNLEWCDHSYNEKHAIEHGLVDKRHFKRMSKITADLLGERVNQYTLDGKFIKTHRSYQDAARSVGVTYKSIVRCCKNTNNRHTSAGYKWKRVKDSKLYIELQNLIVKFKQ